jgi:hypothetical protein
MKLLGTAYSWIVGGATSKSYSKVFLSLGSL